MIPQAVEDALLKISVPFLQMIDVALKSGASLPFSFLEKHRASLEVCLADFIACLQLAKALEANPVTPTVPPAA